MKVENRTLRMPARPRGTWLERVGGTLRRQLEPDAYPLRLSIVGVRDAAALIEVTVVTGWQGPSADDGGRAELLVPRPKAYQAREFAVVHVVPTGVRCELGGYAGDACPVTNLLAAAADSVVTHPNAVNASDVNELAANVRYVEGKSLDGFLLGHLGLRPVTANRIGTFVDPAGLELLDDVTNCLNAARAAAGIDCAVYTVLRDSLGVRMEWSDSGCAVGTVLNPEVLLAAVEELLAEGVEAVGGVSVIHGVTRDMFRRHLKGEIPNPSGGVEAILTHLISAWFRVPTAHAPLPYYRQLKGRTTRNPRAAAEFISTPHYFSVLKGLSRAPRPVELAGLESPASDLLTLNNVGAVVMPATCLGGIPALAAEFSGVPVIAVRENRTTLDVANVRMRMSNVIEVESYLEAAGIVLALRRGISLESLRRPLGPVRRAALAEAPALAAGTEARVDAKAGR